MSSAHCSRCYRPPDGADRCDHRYHVVWKDKTGKGCFVVNTALEVAPHDADFRDLVTNVFDQIEKYLRDCIVSGQSDGTIRTKLPAADLARLFLGATLGIRVLARTSSERELLTGVVRPLFALLQAT